jgi:type IX secretion system PorP/SprF family membrane protein
MRNIYILLGLVLMIGTTYGQQRPVQSLYMFDPLLVNPAYAGTQTQLSATAIFRNQWVNLEGSPQTFTATAHSGFRQNKVGLGVIMGKDVIGIHDDLSFYGVYAYKIKLDKTTSLSMGLQGGFNNFKSDYNKLVLKNPGDPNLSGTTQKFLPNVGAGLYLRHKSYYVGLSVPYLINNKLVYYNETESLSKQHRYYYLMGGLSYQITPVIQLVPSTLIRLQEKAPLSFDVNLTTVLYRTVGLGVSYRLGNGAVGLFELQLNENFHVGYAYDFTTTDLNQFSNGTHEIMVNYRIKFWRIHKGLECPSYW